MTTVATRLNVSGIFGGSAVLLVCGFTHEIAHQATDVFLFCLLLPAAGTAILIRKKRYRYAGTMAVVFAVLVALSCQRWYVPHSTPGPDGFERHWHDIWNLGHVH